MLNSPVGWVESAESELPATNQVSLPHYAWIAESLNPTPNLTLSRWNDWSALLHSMLTFLIPSYIIPGNIILIFASGIPCEQNAGASYEYSSRNEAPGVE